MINYGKTSSTITSLQKIKCKINLNQLKLKVNDTYKNDEKITNFEPSNDENVINKAYLDEKLSKIEVHI